MDKNIPSIGLTPRSVWNSKRLADILDAMERYSKAGKPVPTEWVSELRQLIASTNVLTRGEVMDHEDSHACCNWKGGKCIVGNSKCPDNYDCEDFD